MISNHEPEKPEVSEQIQKPSLISQVVPFLFAAAILVWVFTRLSSNVVDERHELRGSEWSELEGRGVRPGSIEAKSTDGSVTYCEAERIKELDGAEREVLGCPPGGDFEVRPETRDLAAAVRRTQVSRIQDGAVVSVNYVKKINLSDIWSLVSGADLSYFLPAMIAFSVAFFLADAFAFGLAYKWFSVPDLKVREMMEIRAAPYIIQVILAPLAEVLFPLYLWRVKKVPLADTFSSNIWTIFIDLSAVLTAITPAVIYNLYVENLVPAIGPGWLIGCIIFWVWFLGNLVFWHSPYRERASAWIASWREDAEIMSWPKRITGEILHLLRTFSLGHWSQYLKVYLIRLCLLSFTLSSNYFALRAMGLDPPLPLVIIGVPIVVLSIFQPIGVGGYGGTQLIAWYLFVKVGQAGTADQAIAYSLLWSTGFLVGRAFFGLIFIRGFWKRCFPEGFRL